MSLAPPRYRSIRNGIATKVKNLGVDGTLTHGKTRESMTGAGEGSDHRKHDCRPYGAIRKPGSRWYGRSESAMPSDRLPLTIFTAWEY